MVERSHSPRYTAERFAHADSMSSVVARSVDPRRTPGARKLGLSIWPAAVVGVLLPLTGCGGDRTGIAPPDTSAETGDTAAVPGQASAGPALSDADGGSDGADWFTDRADAVGLDLLHVNGASGEFFYPEILPPGVGLFDYDNDGDLDAFIVQGQRLGAGKTSPDALMPPAATSPRGGRLYRNDLQAGADGARSLRFTDVTEAAEITADGYGLGVATGDIDNDGWVDLLVTNFGQLQLFRNRADGTFADVSSWAGLDEHGEHGEFGVAAAFVDYDRDGWLDLYVGNNVDYRLDNDTECPNMAGARDYCPPQTYGGLQDRLYRNRGDGTFDDRSATALVGGRFGAALGVATADYDGDGWIDIYVANDGAENLLWINQRDGTFEDMALLSGAALSALGTPEASMGVSAGDFDNDGDEDLFMTHLTTEGNNLYVNDGSGLFQDRSAPSGLGSQSLSYTGWGAAWFDFDNDGWLDLLAVNGTVVAVEGRGDDPFPYDQQNTLFRNLGNGRFEDVTERAGAVFELSEVGRGAAFGDVDNDGDVDVLVGNNTGRPRLLINTIGNRSHWVGLRLVGEAGRDMLGARVAVIRGDGPTLWRRVKTDGSYASASDPRVLVGLGESSQTPMVRVQWPGGRVEEFSDVAVDQWTTLSEGGGRPQESLTR